MNWNDVKNTVVNAFRTIPNPTDLETLMVMWVILLSTFILIVAPASSSHLLKFALRFPWFAFRIIHVIEFLIQLLPSLGNRALRRALPATISCVFVIASLSHNDSRGSVQALGYMLCFLLALLLECSVELYEMRDELFIRVHCTLDQLKGKQILNN